MQHSSLKPYLLGQQQLPTCSNCKVDKLWSHFCQFKSMGPVCPQWDQDHLMEALMGRWACWTCHSVTHCLVPAQVLYRPADFFAHRHVHTLHAAHGSGYD